ncbi:hypothetical protein, partial [Vibrio parahaemolyticus]|uniref:hypothetical protein n=1 Tax=Vibrio parahaemolyticus TaxID=670 RepID=UPI002361484D
VIFLFDLPISIRPRSGLKGSDRWLTERFHRFGQQRPFRYVILGSYSLSLLMSTYSRMLKQAYFSHFRLSFM